MPDTLVKERLSKALRRVRCVMTLFSLDVLSAACFQAPDLSKRRRKVPHNLVVAWCQQ